MSIDVKDLPKMGRKMYISIMEGVGFPHIEAVKMADYAIPDFGSYEAAYEYYRTDEKFWFRGWIYAGHRKARRTFWLDRNKRYGGEKMAVDVKDLPPAYQMQALRKLAERERKKRRTPLPSPAAAPSKGSKYHNKPTERVAASGKVIHFQSQKEARRFDELMPMLQAGEIRGLKLQPQFTLQEAYTTTEGIRVQAIRYQADFMYEKLVTERYATDGGGSYEYCDEWVQVVEDVKSRATKTRVYAMKKKLMREKFGIDIQEV